MLLSCLSHSGAELERAIKKRRYYLYELAELIAGSDDSQSVLSPSESTVEQFNLLLERLEEREDKEDYISLFLDHEETFTVSALCRFLSQKLKCGRLSSAGLPEGQSICYFQSRFSDNAYLAFSSVLRDARASYTDDFSSACEGVYLGKYDYCIIPTESYSDGQMTRFIGLMMKYELFITLSCKAMAADGSFTTFDLLCASPGCVDRPDRMAITAIPGSSCPLSRLLTIAEIMGARTLSCTGLPERLGLSGAYYIKFDISDSDPDALALALTLTLPSLTVNGIYKEIPCNNI